MEHTTLKIDLRPVAATEVAKAYREARSALVDGWGATQLRDFAALACRFDDLSEALYDIDPDGYGDSEADFVADVYEHTANHMDAVLDSWAWFERDETPDNLSNWDHAVERFGEWADMVAQEAGV